MKANENQLYQLAESIEICIAMVSGLSFVFSVQCLHQYLHFIVKIIARSRAITSKYDYNTEWHGYWINVSYFKFVGSSQPCATPNALIWSGKGGGSSAMLLSDLCVSFGQQPRRCCMYSMIVIVVPWASVKYMVIVTPSPVQLAIAIAI